MHEQLKNQYTPFLPPISENRNTTMTRHQPNLDRTHRQETTVADQELVDDG